MATKAIKGVDEEKWAAFKAVAAKNNMTVGELFNESVDVVEYRHAKSQWERILANRVSHPKGEWDEIEDKVKHFRKNFRFRAFK